MKQQTLSILISVTLILSFFAGCDSSDANKSPVIKTESKLNDSLITQLRMILEDDQLYRSDTGLAAIQKQSQNDYFNSIAVQAILDKYGWLGPEVVGTQGSDALFLVIQHSYPAVQIKYLPMLRQAVIDGKASGKQWALLEDRVGVATVGTQIYGSQININHFTGKHTIAPIRDEKNVNKRRKAIGLPPLEEYAKEFGIVYNLPEN